MADLDCSDDVGFRGQNLGIDVSANDLRGAHHSVNRNWNDEICSFVVNAGYWKMYENADYGGLATQTFGPGTRIRSCPDAGFPNNWISSIARVSRAQKGLELSVAYTTSAKPKKSKKKSRKTASKRAGTRKKK